MLAPVYVGRHQHAGKNAVAANAAGPECVLIAKGGAIIDVKDTNELCFASMLAGDDGRTLFMMMGISAAWRVATGDSARQHTGRQR